MGVGAGGRGQASFLRIARCRRTAVAVAAVALAAAATSPNALAHATLVRSSPADGSVAARPPSSIRLEFAGIAATRFRRLDLRDLRGRRIELKSVRAINSAAGTVLVVRVPKLDRGVYSLFWRVLSEQDGHVRSGLLVFGVGRDRAIANAVGDARRGGRPLGPAFALGGAVLTVALLAALGFSRGRRLRASQLLSVGSAAAALAATATATVLLGAHGVESALRSLDLASLLLLTGALAAVFAVTPSDESPPAARARRRTLNLAVLAAVSGLAVGVAILLWEVAQLGEPSPGPAWIDAAGELLGRTRWGVLWLAHEGLLAAATALLLRRPDERRRPPAVFATIAFALVAGLIAVHALGTHAASARGAGTAVAADAIHVLGAGIWIGGLAAAILAAWPLFGAASDPALVRTTFTRFGWLAVPALAALLVTGLYSAGVEVASPDALLRTGYGQALLVKSALAAAAVVLGLANGLAFRPLRRESSSRLTRPDRRVRTTLVAEACVGAAVVAAAAIVATGVPARGLEWLSPGAAARSEAIAWVDDLVTTLAVKPGRPGPNVFDVSVASTRRPPPSTLRRVSLRFTAPGGPATGPVAMRQVEPGRYQLGGSFLRTTGRWRIEVIAERPPLRSTRTSLSWDVRPAPRAALVSLRPLRGPLSAAAGLLALAFLAGAVSFACFRLLDRHAMSRPAPPGPSVPRPREQAR